MADGKTKRLRIQMHYGREEKFGKSLIYVTYLKLIILSSGFLNYHLNIVFFSSSQIDTLKKKPCTKPCL